MRNYRLWLLTSVAVLRHITGRWDRDSIRAPATSRKRKKRSRRSEERRDRFAGTLLLAALAVGALPQALSTATRLIRYTHSANLIAYGDRRISLGGYHVVGGLDDHCDVLPARTAPCRERRSR